MRLKRGFLIKNLFFFLFIFPSVFPKKAEYKQFLKVFKYENCPSSKNLNPQFKVTYFNVTNFNFYQQVTNVQFTISPPIPSEIKIKAQVQKCITTDYNSCSTILRIVGNLYPLMKSFTNLLGEQIYNLIQPPISVPLKPGEYKLFNFTGDVDKLLTILKTASLTNVYNDYWNVRLLFLNEKELGCANHMFKVYNVRVRN